MKLKDLLFKLHGIVALEINYNDVIVIAGRDFCDFTEETIKPLVPYSNYDVIKIKGGSYCFDSIKFPGYHYEDAILITLKAGD